LFEPFFVFLFYPPNDVVDHDCFPVHTLSPLYVCRSRDHNLDRSPEAYQRGLSTADPSELERFDAVILFDDNVRTGATFVGARRLLSPLMPEAWFLAAALAPHPDFNSDTFAQPLWSRLKQELWWSPLDAVARMEEEEDDGNDEAEGPEEMGDETDEDNEEGKGASDQPEMKDVLAQARSVVAAQDWTPAQKKRVLNSLARVERRTVGKRPGRAGRTRVVLLEKLTGTGAKEKGRDLAKQTVAYLNGRKFNDETLQLLRNPDVYQNNGTGSDKERDVRRVPKLGKMSQHGSGFGVYVMQLRVNKVPKGSPPKNTSAFLKKLDLEPRQGSVGQREVGKTLSSFGKRHKQYTARKGGEGGNEAASNKAISRHLVAAEVSWPGIKIAVDMFPAWVGTGAQRDDTTVTIMECLMDCDTHSGPTPGNSGSAVQAARGEKS
jgi:hypothetical protein